MSAAIRVRSVTERPSSIRRCVASKRLSLVEQRAGQRFNLAPLLGRGLGREAAQCLRNEAPTFGLPEHLALSLEARDHAIVRGADLLRRLGGRWIS